jgi:hypothetical protein
MSFHLHLHNVSKHSAADDDRTLFTFDSTARTLSATYGCLNTLIATVAREVSFDTPS